jgi:hypothetical protein
VPRPGRRLRALGTLAVMATPLVASGGCAEDRILPVASVCGDRQVTGEEECDLDSPGCVDCRIATGWDCTDTECHGVCGDGKVVGSEQCDPPNGKTCDASCKSAGATSGCDLSGYYAVHQTDYSRDTIIGQVQTSSNWYFYHFAQNGNDFSVDQRALYCGLYVTGSVTVSLDDPGLVALLYSNRQDPGGAHGARRGTFRQNGDTCELTFERWYLVRGVVESMYLPADFSAEPALTDLTPLPTVPDPLHPPATPLPGVTDPDGDGHPGLDLHLSGNLTGVRNVIQRDWDSYETDPANPISPGSIELTARSVFDSEEHVLSVTACAPATCSLIQAGAVPAHDLPGHVTFRYLGKTLDDPRVAAIAGGAPGASQDVDLATCKNVRAAMPHDPSTP